MPDQTSTLLAGSNVDDHPMVRDANAEHEAQLSAVEKVCKSIADMTGAPIALLFAIVLQFVWVIVGTISHWDPFPFVFLLTVSNIIQLVLIFVIAVAEKQSSQHAELRAEIDHDHISRLLHHQEVQEELLLRLAAKTQVEVADVLVAVKELATAP